MDTFDKFFQLQKSLSNDLCEIAKQQRKAQKKEEIAKLERKYETVWKLYQQVCDIILPY